MKKKLNQEALLSLSKEQLVTYILELQAQIDILKQEIARLKKSHLNQ